MQAQRRYVRPAPRSLQQTSYTLPRAVLVGGRSGGLASFRSLSYREALMGERTDPLGASDDEKQPMTTAMSEPMPVRNVHVKRPPARGCFVTRSQIVMLVTLVLLLVLIVAVLTTILILPRCRCLRRNDNPFEFSMMQSIRPTLDPSLPWSDLRLPEHLVPTEYRLVLDIDLDHFTFSGEVDIDVNCQSDTEYVILNCFGLTIRESRVRVRDRDTEQVVDIRMQRNVPLNQLYVVQLKEVMRRGKRYTVTFKHFSGLIDDDLRGLYRSSYTDAARRTRYLAVSQLQSVDARRVFPCFDEPDLKANFSVSIVHDKAFQALSNMPIRRSTSYDGNRVKSEFRPTPRMSTYLLAFVVAEFTFREGALESGLKVRIWSQPSMRNQTEYALSFCLKSYQFFSDYFDMPEVVPKADHVAVPDLSSGAMENWGLVIYRETTLLHHDSVSSIFNKQHVSLVIAHEVAHTWFGNMATMKWWDDLWLNEGFANTLMYFALDNANPEWKVYDVQLVDNLFPVMIKDALLTSHPISAPIRDPDDIPRFFDSISYDKGMAVLRLLRNYLGWDHFRKGLQKFIKTYKFKNADMNDLWETFSETQVSGAPTVKQIMDTWTRQMGHPVVKISYQSSGVYRVSQRRYLLNPDQPTAAGLEPSTYRYKWMIPFSYCVQRDSRIQNTMLRRDATLDIKVGLDRWVLGNMNYVGFFRTNYDDDMWARLIHQLKVDHKVFSVANRAGLISDAFNLARANLLSYDVAFNVTSYLDKEEDYVPWRAFLDAMGYIRGMLATSNPYGKLREFMAKLVAFRWRRVGMSDTGGLLLRSLRTYALEAATALEIPDAVQWAKQAFNSWMNYNNILQPDYAQAIYMVGVQEGGQVAWDHVWNKSRSSQVASQTEAMLKALAYSREPWLLWRLARWSLDSRQIRLQDIRNLFSYFSATPLGRSVALQFMLNHWDKINDRFGVDPFLLRDIIYTTTALVNREYDYKQIQELFRRNPPHGVARKEADNALALIRANINWMALHRDSIDSWLTRNGRKENSNGRPRRFPAAGSTGQGDL